MHKNTVFTGAGRISGQYSIISGVSLVEPFDPFSGLKSFERLMLNKKVHLGQLPFFSQIELNSKRALNENCIFSLHNRKILRFLNN